jgi:hypothetical protein
LWILPRVWHPLSKGWIYLLTLVPPHISERAITNMDSLPGGGLESTTTTTRWMPQQTETEKTT